MNKKKSLLFLLGLPLLLIAIIFIVNLYNIKIYALATSIGIREMTHDCVGIVKHEKGYSLSLVSAINNSAFTRHAYSSRPTCIGIDVWYGE